MLNPRKISRAKREARMNREVGPRVLDIIPAQLSQVRKFKLNGFCDVRLEKYGKLSAVVWKQMNFANWKHVAAPSMWQSSMEEAIKSTPGTIRRLRYERKGTCHTPNANSLDRLECAYWHLDRKNYDFMIYCPPSARKTLRVVCGVGVGFYLHWYTVKPYISVSDPVVPPK